MFTSVDNHTGIVCDQNITYHLYSHEKMAAHEPLFSWQHGLSRETLSYSMRHAKFHEHLQSHGFLGRFIKRLSCIS
jgi:hypothetical protein